MTYKLEIPEQQYHPLQARPAASDEHYELLPEEVNKIVSVINALQAVTGPLWEDGYAGLRCWYPNAEGVPVSYYSAQDAADEDLGGARPDINSLWLPLLYEPAGTSERLLLSFLSEVRGVNSGDETISSLFYRISELGVSLDSLDSTLSSALVLDQIRDNALALGEAINTDETLKGAIESILAVVSANQYRDDVYAWAVVDSLLNVLLAVDVNGVVFGKFDYSGMPDKVKAVCSGDYSMMESSEYRDAWALVDRSGIPLMVIRDDGRIAVESASFNGLDFTKTDKKESYAFAMTDSQDNVLFGITYDGEVYFRASADSVIAIEKVSISTSEYLFYSEGGSILAHSLSDSSITTVVVDGRLVSSVSANLDELHWFEGDNAYYAKAPNFTKVSALPISRVVCWGDSLTTGSGGVDGYPAELARITGLAVSSQGAGGQGSQYIAARAGGLDIVVSTETGFIPAISSVVALENTITQRPMSSIGPQTMAGNINGVNGVLARTESNTFTFERDQDGDQIDTDGGVVFEPYLGDFKERIVIIWAGRNNISDARQVLEDVKSIVGTLTPKALRFFVLSVINSETEGVGTDGYASIENINNLLFAEYPGQYIDVRAALVNAYDPLNDADSLDYQADRVPNSLRADHVHLNQTGYNLVASTIRDQMLKKRWLLQ